MNREIETDACILLIQCEKQITNKVIGTEKQIQSPSHPLCTDLGTIHAEDSKEPTEKLLEQIREFCWFC